MDRRTLIHLELIIAATIIAFTIIQVINPGHGASVAIWLGLIAAITLIIHVLKQSRDPRVVKVALICGLALIAGGVGVVMIPEISGIATIQPIDSTGLIVSGMVLILLTVRSKSDLEVRDERTIRIGTYGLSYSWYLTYLVIAAIGWAMATDAIEISGVLICMTLIILMPVSAMIFQWYFNTRGDVY